MMRYRCIKMVQFVHNLREQIVLGNTPYVNATAEEEHTNAGETPESEKNNKLRKEPDE